MPVWVRLRRSILGEGLGLGGWQGGGETAAGRYETWPQSVRSLLTS